MSPVKVGFSSLTHDLSRSDPDGIAWLIRQYLTPNLTPPHWPGTSVVVQYLLLLSFVLSFPLRMEVPLGHEGCRKRLWGWKEAFSARSLIGRSFAVAKCAFVWSLNEIFYSLFTSFVQCASHGSCSARSWNLRFWDHLLVMTYSCQVKNVCMHSLNLSQKIVVHFKVPSIKARLKRSRLETSKSAAATLCRCSF